MNLPPTTPPTNPPPVVFFVAGCKFRIENVEVVCGKLNHTSPSVPQPIILRAEPNNAFDPLAVKVFLFDQHIGYVPKTHNTILHENKSKGFRTSATLLGYYPASPTYNMFQVQCTFTQAPS